MTTFVRKVGSLVRGESCYSDEPDPWENDTPLSFQSVRRESRAKPPTALRIPRSFTLPNLLSFRSHLRNRSSNDDDYIPYSPVSARAAHTPRRTITFTRQRVVDDHNVVGDISPRMPSTLLIWKNKAVKQKDNADSELGDVSKNGMKDARQDAGRDLEDIGPVSPVSEDTENEVERSSRMDRLRGKVRHALRLRRTERA